MQRIFSIVLIIFIMITIFTIPMISKKYVVRTNMEIDEMVKPTSKIYLRDENDYLVEVQIFIPNTIESIIDYLKEDNQENEKWKGYIPDSTKIIDYKLEDKRLTINFSKEFKTIEKKYLPGLIKSLFSIMEIEEIAILVENERLEGYEQPFQKNIPINIEWNIINRNNIEKVVIYYLEPETEDCFVPITKYKNSTEEKIETIIQELQKNIPNNLVSYLNNKIELLNYEIENDMIILEFNKSLLNENNKSKVIIEELSKSIFDNYNVSSILLKNNGTLEKIITKNNLK